METILSLNNNERALYFQEAAAQSDKIKSPIIIEKDFWVCFALKKIFSINEISQHITFKGGTSLSKCYQIIDRFSEDCDLTIDKSFLGINENIKDLTSKGRSQRDKSLSTLASAAKNKINNDIKSLLHINFSNTLNNYFDGDTWRIESDPTDLDEQTLLFHYPTAVTTTNNEYIRTSVKLEFGARGDTTPNELREITPYLYESIPTLFNDKPPSKCPH